MATRNHATPDDQLPTLGSIAESGIGLTVWCDNDACAYRRENGGCRGARKAPRKC